MSNRRSASIIGVFLLFIAAFYFLGYWLIYRMGQATPLMLSVGLATLCTCVVMKKPIASLGWQWGVSEYQWASYLIPLLLIAITYTIIWGAGLGGWYNTEFIAEQQQRYNLHDWSQTSFLVFYVLMTATITFMIALSSVLGEEIGWRGLLVPELSKLMSFTGMAIISGLLWSVWHWPLIFLGIYGNDQTPLMFQLLFFTVFITSHGVIMAYLRLKSGSVWTAVIYHMSLNVFLQKVFTPLTVQNEHSAWYVDEFGAVSAVITFIVAVFVLIKGHRQFDRLKEGGHPVSSQVDSAKNSVHSLA